MLAELIVAALAGLFFLIQVASCLIAFLRFRGSAAAEALPADLPPISLVRPVCGIECNSTATLASSFSLAYPRYEILFCVADVNDPIIPLVEAAIARNPNREARLLIGEDLLSLNPKLNNMAKGWHAARHDHVAFVDSNVLLPPAFLQNLVAAWRPGTGAVSAPPIATDPVGFWSLVECAFLNMHEARWQYVADTAGMGFAQGKTLFFRKSVFGLSSLTELAKEPAEDAATTRLVRSLGLKVRLAPPSPQPLGRRTAQEVWSRQVRWARLRRITFPLEFMPEILIGYVPVALALAYLAPALGLNIGVTIGLGAIAWFTPEVCLAWACKWPIDAALPLALLLRDCLNPVMWFAAWIGRDFVWKGSRIEAPRQTASNGVGAFLFARRRR